MAFDHDTVETKKYAAVRFTWIHLVTQRAEGLTCKQITKPCRPGSIHRRAQIRCQLMCRPFRGLQGDVVGKSFGDHDVHCAFADVVTLDKAMIVEMWKPAFTQNAPRFAHLLESFDLLDTAIEQPARR